MKRWTIQITETIVLTALVFVFLLWGIPWIRAFLSGSKSSHDQQAVQNDVESAAPREEPDLSYAANPLVSEAAQQIDASRPIPPLEEPILNQPVLNQSILDQPTSATSEQSIPGRSPRVERLSLVPPQSADRPASLSIPDQNNNIFH